MNTYKVISKTQGVCVASFNTLDAALAYKGDDENLIII
jgi:hypothetical protein